MLDLSEQIHLDQRRYSRYVCDSRAIPNVIDGLKPVQRRILWTMWNSKARDHHTKTVKVAGLVMGYHPHGDASIQEALSQMAQEFTFANNYSLISGDGTFGDVLDPKAIASPRYTEVKISDFAKDMGLFESIPDLDYVPNYDATSKEPVFFVPRVPILLLNPIIGIATGFSCNIPGHRFRDVAESTLGVIQNKAIQSIQPWYKDFHGYSDYTQNDKGKYVYKTGFCIQKKDHGYYLTGAPQGWNREKTILYLEDILAENAIGLKGYIDHSRSQYQIELVFKRAAHFTLNDIKQTFSKTNQEVIIQNVITSKGKLIEQSNEDIIFEFVGCRRTHLKKRFQRLAKLEKQKIDKHNELIRFIQEKWYQKVTQFQNKKELETILQHARFIHYEWLSELALYRMTLEEVSKCKTLITEAKKQYKHYKSLYSNQALLDAFMIKEITSLIHKWDPHEN